MSEDYPDEYRFVYRHFPIGHDKSNISTQAAEAAGLQGKFWEMSDVLYDLTTWQEWAGMTVDDFKIWVTGKAGELGLDVAQFTADLESPAMVQITTNGQDAAQAAGLGGTPSLFILLDGKLIFTPSDGVSASYQTLHAILQLWKMQNRQFAQCPAMTIDTAKTYTATLETTKGEIVIELYADVAPITVNSFVFLAENGWFDNVPWHRVLDDFVAQTGDPSGTGFGGPGYEFKNEISPDLKFDAAGVVAMANSGADTNGSQFFITMSAQPSLDGSYTIFGKVISGLEVLDLLTRRDPANETELAEPDLLVSVTIAEN